jgi:hypothetical protein
MAELTGLFGFDWAIVFFTLFGGALAAMSRRRDVRGLRVAGFLLIPLWSGIGLVVALWVRFPNEISRFLPFLRRPVTALLMVGVAVMAVAMADLVFSRLARLPGRLWNGSSRPWLGDLGLLIFVGGAALVSLGAMLGLATAVYIQPAAPGLSGRLTVQAAHPLPSGPLGVAVRSESDGYLSLGDRVAHFEMPQGSGGSLTLTTAADGFTYARGLTIADDTLVVADLGPLPCPRPFPYCKGHDVPGVGLIEGERRILEESRGRLVAFDIRPDGTLTNERVILSHLPVANTEHGINGLATGPDGYIYVAIGNLDHLPIEMAESVDRPNADLLGTVVRLSPEGDDVKVFARGLRNVYGLAFDDRGGLWGVDNDGETASGWRAEEVLHIRRGRNYGYPYEGSFGPQEVRNDLAIWRVGGVGSAGILWAGEVGLGPGLLIGSCGRLDGLRLTDFDGEWLVESATDYARLLDLPGCVTDIKPIGPDQMIVSIFRTNSLYLLQVEREAR